MGTAATAAMFDRMPLRFYAPRNGPDAVTLGELSRRIDRIDSQLQQNFRAIDDRLTSQLVSRDYYETRHANLQEDLTLLRNQMSTAASYRWALLTGVFVSLIAAGGAVAASLVH